jgi:hypothetical protein
MLTSLGYANSVTRQKMRGYGWLMGSYDWITPVFLALFFGVRFAEVGSIFFFD